MATPLVLLRRHWRRDDFWTTLNLTLLAGFVLNSLSVLLLTLVVGVAERYVVDFLPFGILLALLTSFALLQDARRSSRVSQRRIITLFIAVVSSAGLVCSGLAIAMRSDPVERLPALARAANTLVAKVEHWRGVHYGPMTLRVRFHDFTVGHREPLLVSGDGRDIVYVDYVSADKIQLGLDHSGSVNLSTDPLTIDVGKEHTLELDLGNLYPPPEHPLFAGIPLNISHALRHRLIISLDGTTVLQLGCTYYPTQPSDTFLGKDGPSGIHRFSGTIVSAVQHGLPNLATLTGPGLRNPSRLTVTFPRFQNFHTEPLISSGPWGDGDLLYVTFVGPNKIRFGHDNRGGGAIESETMDYVPEQPVTLDVDLPPLRPGFDASQLAPLVVRFADQIVFDDQRPFHSTQPFEVFLGYNGVNSTIVGQLFQGRIQRVEPLRDPILRSNDQISSGTGPFRLTLHFPTAQLSRSEPLLVTGSAGAGDVVYVHYVDETHIRIGYDHWSAGGPVSPPIAINFSAVHVVEISLGSLYPAPTDHAWNGIAESDRLAARSRVSVKLDGRTILETQQTAYASDAHQIKVGRNSIGASTCEPRFTGKISAQERLGLRPTP